MEGRIGSLRKIFREKGLDGYLVLNNFNILYLTGFSGATGLLIPSEGECTLFVYGVNYEQAKAEAKSCSVVLVQRGEKLEEKIGRKIKGLKIGNLGFDGLSSALYLKLRRVLRGSTRLKAKGELVWELRKIKTGQELELMRKAAEIASEGMRVARETLRAGLTEIEVAAEIEYAMRKKGSWGTSFETIVASGARSAYPHGGCTEKQIRKGEAVVIDLGAIYKYYRSDMTRTMVAGKPSKKQQQIYNIVKTAQDKAFKRIREGVRAKTLDAAARKIIEKAGYSEYFVHGLGHGIGLEVHEPPTLNQQSKDVLKAGNVVTVEPGIYITGFGGFRIEDTVLVQRDGGEKLTFEP
jgi:Xaa-Pro dipeptidase